MLNHLPVLQVLFPLVAAPLCLLLRKATLVWAWTVLATLAALVTSGLLIADVETQGSLSYHLGGWEPPWGIEYRIDKLNAFMFLIINFVALMSLLTVSSISEQVNSSKQYLFYALFLLNLAGLNGIIATADAFNVFVFIEIASLSSYALISQSKTRQAYYSAYRYLIFGSLGASFILIAIGLLYAITGSLNLYDIAGRLQEVDNERAKLSALAFFSIGIFLKAAVFPFHVWLPSAYQNAPNTISMYFAGTTTKVFIYVLLRFAIFMFGLEYILSLSFDVILMTLAILAMLYGSWRAMSGNDLKLILAWSSVAQIGYMLLGISMFTEAGLSAGLLHIFNHALIKTALFCSVLVIIYQTGKQSTLSLNGLIHQMPLVTICFIISGLSLIGVPATAGFVSKWYLVTAAYDIQNWFVIVAIVVSSLMAVLYVWKIVETFYFKVSRYEVELLDKPKPMFSYISLFVLTVANIYFGLQTDFSLGMTDSISQTLLSND